MAKILITGGNRGIGLALVAQLLKEGQQVMAGVRNPSQAGELNQLATKDTEEKGSFRVIALDVTSPESVRSAAEETRRHWGQLDVLVNNAAVFPEEGDESLEDLNVEHFTAAFATNVTGVAQMCQAFLPLLKQGDHPRIVNISSGAGSITAKDDSKYYCYGASKAALNMFTRTLAHETNGLGILTVALSPGWVRTEMGGANAQLTPEESACAIAQTIQGLEKEKHGQFLGRDGNIADYQW